MLAWRRTCGLTGGSEAYDYSLACLGNPDAHIVFLAEIPSLTPPGRKLLPNYPPNERWKKVWNVSPGDKTFRAALAENEFIPEATIEEPWKWRCWITNIVKCEETDKLWKTIKRRDKTKRQEILSASATFLQEELRIIQPKMIVVMGNETRKLYYEFVHSDILDVWAPHYARMTEARKPDYFARFGKIKKWYEQLQ